MAKARTEMLEASIKADWNRTSSLMALTANIHRDPKKRPRKPSEYNPFAATAKQAPTKAEIDAEREMVIASMKLKTVTRPASEMRRTPAQPAP